MMKIHNKLVRDLIPDIISRDGKTAHTRILSPEDYLAALETKLLEETNEYLSSPCMEELADMLEVMEAICRARGYDMQAVLAIKTQKQKERGGFDKRIFLESVE